MRVRKQLLEFVSNELELRLKTRMRILNENRVKIKMLAREQTTLKAEISEAYRMLEEFKEGMKPRKKTCL